MAAYRNDGMYTGLPVQTGFVSFLDNSGEHPEEKRRAEKLANDAVKRCHAALKKDIARRKRHGADERDGGSDGAFEPLLDDLGFYLPCIMTVNRRRFCSPNQRKELVRRVEAYFNVLQASRKAAARRAPRVSPGGLNYVFFKLAEDMGGDDYRINYTPDMALLSPDPRLLAALQDLIALGYLDLEDFAAFFGLFVSVDIRPLFDTVKRQENSCGR
jgi:hypothetical protein